MACKPRRTPSKRPPRVTPSAFGRLATLHDALAETFEALELDVHTFEARIEALEARLPAAEPKPAPSSAPEPGEGRTDAVRRACCRVPNGEQYVAAKLAAEESYDAGRRRARAEALGEALGALDKLLLKHPSDNRYFSRQGVKDSIRAIAALERKEAP
jgi:hypothetical protein